MLTPLLDSGYDEDSPQPAELARSSCASPMPAWTLAPMLR
jgi:hypothetical protein